MSPLEQQKRRSHNRHGSVEDFYIALSYIKLIFLWSHLECYSCQITSTMWFFLHFLLTLIEQLQVSNWHFAILIPPLPHQPIRVHAWHSAHGDHLTGKYLTIKTFNDSFYDNLKGCDEGPPHRRVERAHCCWRRRSRRAHEPCGCLRCCGARWVRVRSGWAAEQVVRRPAVPWEPRFWRRSCWLADCY